MFNLIINKLLSTANAKDLRSYCSDFRNESNGIFVIGVGFFSDKLRLFN